MAHLLSEGLCKHLTALVKLELAIPTGRNRPNLQHLSRALSAPSLQGFSAALLSASWDFLPLPCFSCPVPAPRDYWYCYTCLLVRSFPIS